MSGPHFQPPQDFFVNYSQVWTPALLVTPLPHLPPHAGPPNSKATESHMGHRMLRGVWGGGGGQESEPRSEGSLHCQSPPAPRLGDTPCRPRRLPGPARTPVARTPLPDPRSRAGARVIDYVFLEYETQGPNGGSEPATPRDQGLPRPAGGRPPPDATPGPRQHHIPPVPGVPTAAAAARVQGAPSPSRFHSLTWVTRCP